MTGRRNVAAAAAVVAAAAVAVPSGAVASDGDVEVAQVVEAHRQAVDRAEVVGRLVPQLQDPVRELVDATWAGRLLDVTAPRGGGEADATPTPSGVRWTTTDLDTALAAADLHLPNVDIDQINDRAADTPDLNYHGLHPTRPGSAPDSGTTTPDLDRDPGAGTGDVWLCPVQGTVSFTNDWGFPRSGGRRHEGNDLFADTGTPLVAVTDATVTRTNPIERGLGGITITITSDAGVSWYYAHLDQLADLTVGDRVTTGQQLGTVGNTGNARTTPPHLHIGRYANGAATNPYPYLRPRC